MSELVVSGLEKEDLLGFLREKIRRTRPSAIAIASAFVSVSGISQVRDLLDRYGVNDCHLVAGLDFALTHPEALTNAVEARWGVRIGTSRLGIFHPKFAVAGKTFTKHGLLREPSWLLVGSANATGGGLSRNVECALFSNDEPDSLAGALAFFRVWQSSRPLTADLLRSYAASFAKANRERTYDTLTALGINDGEMKRRPSAEDLKRVATPRRAAVASEFAAEVWAELRSYTGEYAFQVEFPRTAGEVLNRLVGTSTKPNSKVDVDCEDGETRSMTYRYYTDNSMYRLNVPNSVPGVSRARTERNGIALVRRGPEGGAPISLLIVPPGVNMDVTVARSYALDSWGRTSTRLFGWY